MSPQTLPQKLRLQANHRALVLNPPPGYMEKLAPLPEGVQLDTAPQAGPPYDFVQLFVRDIADLELNAPAALNAAIYDGLLWVAYPKGGSGVPTDINRDRGWQVIHAAGLTPVTQVSLDEVWSALRFRPLDRVGK